MKLWALIVKMLDWLEGLNWSTYFLIMMLLRVFKSFNQALEVISIVKSILRKSRFKTLPSEDDELMQYILKRNELVVWDA